MCSLWSNCSVTAQLLHVSRQPWHVIWITDLTHTEKTGTVITSYLSINSLLFSIYRNSSYLSSNVFFWKVRSGPHPPDSNIIIIIAKICICFHPVLFCRWYLNLSWKAETTMLWFKEDANLIWMTYFCTDTRCFSVPQCIL